MHYALQSAIRVAECSMRQAQNTPVGTAEVALQLPLARLSIFRYDFTNPVELCDHPTAYRLDLSLEPRRTTGGGACLSERGERHQFKPSASCS